MAKKKLPRLTDDAHERLMSEAAKYAKKETRAVADVADGVRSEINWQVGDWVMEAATLLAVRYAESAFWVGYRAAQDPTVMFTE